MGDSKLGRCPNCHSNLLSLGEPHWNNESFVIECPVCHCGRDLQKNTDGRWEFIITIDTKSMLNGNGANDHLLKYSNYKLNTLKLESIK